MYSHPYLAMTLANDRADRLCAAATAHRLVRTSRERRHADRIRRGDHRSATKAGQTGIRSAGPLAIRGAS
jgi:hypothetical protein